MVSRAPCIQGVLAGQLKLKWIYTWEFQGSLHSRCPGKLLELRWSVSQGISMKWAAKVEVGTGKRVSSLCREDTLTGHMKLKWVQCVLKCSVPGIPGGATGFEASTVWGNHRVFHAVGVVAQKQNLKSQKGSWDSMCREHLHRTAKDEVGESGAHHMEDPGRTARAKLSTGHGMQVSVSWAALGC